MRTDRIVIAAVLTVLACAASAAQISGKATLSASGNVVRLDLDQMMAQPFPVCDGRGECDKNFDVLLMTNPRAPLPQITHVDASDPNTLSATLDAPLIDTTDVRVFVNHLTLQQKDGRKDVSAVFSFTPIVSKPTTDAAMLVVRTDKAVVQPPPENVTISVTNDSRSFTRRVTHVECNSDCTSMNLALDKALPAGDTVAVGVDIPGAQHASGKITTTKATTRDDAKTYISANANLAQGAKDTYSYDVKVDQGWERCAGCALHVITFDSIHAVLDSIAGSDKLKLADYGSFSTPVELLVRPDKRTSIGSIRVGPEFRTDKTFTNRDVGLNIVYSVRNGDRFDHSLERQEAQGATDPQFGWRFFVDFGTEEGYHIASEQASVAHTTFARALAKPGVALEHGNWTLSIETQLRYLFRKELAADSDGNVIDVRNGGRWFVRSELSRNVGFVSISVVNTSGRVPPLYKRARATVLGVTLKR